jgi:hypothetical protein
VQQLIGEDASDYTRMKKNCASKSEAFDVVGDRK